MLLLKSLAIWFLFAVLAIINGPAAHVIGTITFITIQFIVVYFFIKKIALTESRKLLFTGLFWLTLTICFEFIFGHYVMGHSWEKLLADYNIFEGRLWCLVLLNTLFSPLICGKILSRH